MSPFSRGRPWLLWLLLRRDRSAWLAYLLFAVLCLLAVSQGLSSARRESAFRSELRHEEDTRVAEIGKAIDAMAVQAKTVAPWNDPRNAGAMGKGRAATYAFLPPTPLAALRTSALQIVSVSSQGGALDRAMGNIENPRLAGIGSFDLAFVLVLLLPLAILGLTFDVIVRDRETGTLRLVIAQGGNSARIYVGRAIVRCAPLLLIALIAVIAALLGFRQTVGPRAGVGLDFVLLAFAIMTYAAFWMSVGLAVQGPFRTPASSGLAALAAWLLLMVAVPALLGAFIDARVPIPSRIERTIAVREATRQASIEGDALLARYYGDHPELAQNPGQSPGQNPAQVPTGSDYYARQVAVSARVRSARAPVEARYREALAEQRALVRLLSAASPVAVIDRLLDDLAGTSRERSDSFVDQVETFQAGFAAFFDTKVLRGERLTRETLGARPTFTFDGEPPSGRAWTVGALLLWCALAFFVAHRGLRAATNFDQAFESRAHIVSKKEQSSS